MSDKLIPKTFFDLWSTPFDHWGVEASHSRGLSISEDKENVFIEASLPGVPSDNIKLSIESNSLLIEGEHKEEKKNRNYHRQAVSSFKYRTALPHGINKEEEPEATYKDGVLTVTFKKAAAHESKKIPIKQA